MCVSESPYVGPGLQARRRRGLKAVPYRLVSVIIVSIALGASQSFAQPPARDAPPATGTSAIRGRVLAVVGDRPLAKAEVRATSGAIRVDKAVLTDANGRYEITELPAGRYIVSVSKPNYVRASYGQRRPLGPGTPIDVAAGQMVAPDASSTSSAIRRRACRCRRCGRCSSTANAACRTPGRRR